MSTRLARWAVAAAVALSVVVADQLLKLAVVGDLALGERREIVGIVAIERTENTGVAFGLASGAPAALVGVAALCVAAVLAWLASRIPWPFGPIGLGLIVGGALGNVADRLTRSAVVDYVDIGPWPTFNLADVAISVGVLLLAIGAIKHDGRANA